LGIKNRFSYLDETTDQSHVSSIQTAEALAAQSTQENFDKGSIFPPFTNIRKISAHIAAAVAAKAYELGRHILCFAFADTVPHHGIHHQVSYLPDLTSSTSLGLATRLPPPRDLVKYAQSCMYTPVYRNYR